MALYAISDFHLSFTTDKPMNVLGIIGKIITKRSKGELVKKYKKSRIK